jgi:beta-glucosidase
MATTVFAQQFPFQNTNLPIGERVDDLVSRLTPDEKIAQMLDETPAIERLGIPAYDWWNECLHGVARTPDYHVTVYPQAIGMAAGFDADAMKKMGDFTAEEGRAIYNDAQKKQDYRRYLGLTYWTPNINIFRDPRWGRGQETYGEDPFLTSVLGTNFVQGLQGDGEYLKAAACAKHFAVHSGLESTRHTFNVSVSDYDLWDTYLPAFKALVDNKVAGVMCAYNAFDGQPCCGSDKLMIDILRNDWGFTGYVTSDCGAINDFYKTHKTHPNAAVAAADAVYHGTDVDCGREAYFGLKQAIADGLISEKQIDVSLKRLFITRFRLGMFDPAGKVSFSNIGVEKLEDPAHKALALKMAHQSMVLLKNNGLLPLKKEKIKKIAVVGPNAHNPEVQLGNYNGFPSRIITPFDGIKEALSSKTEVFTEPLIEYYGETPASLNASVDKIKEADVIVFVGGISPRIEGEEMNVVVDGFYKGDRTSIRLPQIQTEALKALKATGKPVVFVMMTGSAIATPWESENIDAILNAWYGGEFAGKAIADVLFGNCNPSGRLPVTFYAGDADLPGVEDYKMENRTYKYFKGKALYPFGFGLSYSGFQYQWKTSPQPVYKTDDTIRFSFQIKNTGKMDGDEVAQVYIQYPDGKNLPLKELRYFERKTIQKGKTAIVEVEIPVSQFAKWDEKIGKLLVPVGKYSLFAGGNSEDESLKFAFEVKKS